MKSVWERKSLPGRGGWHSENVAVRVAVSSENPSKEQTARLQRAVYLAQSWWAIRDSNPKPSD